jgi:hypothetical protein
MENAYNRCQLKDNKLILVSSDTKFKVIDLIDTIFNGECLSLGSLFSLQ